MENGFMAFHKTTPHNVAIPAKIATAATCVNVIEATIAPMAAGNATNEA